MKRTFTLAGLLLAAASLNAQSTTTVTSENPNARYHVSNNGTFFRNYGEGIGGYIIPKDDNVRAIYTMNLLALGEDVNGQLHGAIAGYEESDFFPGPYANSYDAAYDAAYGPALWPMTREAIDFHIAHWQESGYTPSPMISSWPGNGNAANGEAAVLAPFFDADNDGLYEPGAGDYPEIRGDVAVYSIINDGRNVHPSGTSRAGIEIHLLFYQYDVHAGSADVLNTTFINATVFNRGTLTFFDFHLGAMVDFDLGNYNDDYLGTMIAENVAYVYNADLHDESSSGSLGYGVNPPAVGILALNQDLYSNVVMLDSPQNAAEFYNSLEGLFMNGTPMTDDNGDNTRYWCYGDSLGWNEYTQTNTPGDRRTVMSMASEHLRPQERLCYDFAVIYGKSNGGTLFSSVGELQRVAGRIQEFYDEELFTCAENVAGISGQQFPQLSVYPNPAFSELHILGLQRSEYHMLTTDGKTVLHGTTDGVIDIGVLAEGYYLLVLQNGQTVSFVKK